MAVAVRRDIKLVLHCGKVLEQPCAALRELEVQQRLAVQIEQVERKDLDKDLDILGLDVLALPAAQLLERQEAPFRRVAALGLGDV